MKSKSLLDLSNDLGYFRLSLSNIKKSNSSKNFCNSSGLFLKSRNDFRPTEAWMLNS